VGYTRLAIMNSISQTLADRMTAGRLSVPDALRIGMLLAEQLRQSHDQQIAHGSLSPATVEISGAGIRFIQPLDTAVRAIPYSAPEVLQGNPADARSDIFSFGAILYEMLTGRRAFESDAFTSPWPQPSGSPAVDGLVNGCLAKSPDARFQRVQKLMPELNLLTSAAHRAGSAALTPAVGAPQTCSAPIPPVQTFTVPEPVAHTQMLELEARMAARMQEQEKSIASVAHVANEVLKALRQQQQPAPLAMAAAAPAPRPTRFTSGGSMDEQTTNRVERALDLLVDKVSRMDMVLSSAVERLQKLEQNLDAFDTDAAALRDSVTRDVRNFDRALKAQNTAIESARTAMGQTDDLVERVVEALDSLQSMFVTADEQSLAS
jgi:eukaryotic-like serine/threonine-protein kinase